MLPFGSKYLFCSHLPPKNINLRNVFYLTSYIARQLVLSPMKMHTNGVWERSAEGNILTEDREVTAGSETLILKSFVRSTTHQLLLGWLKHAQWDALKCTKHERWEMLFSLKKNSHKTTESAQRLILRWMSRDHVKQIQLGMDKVQWWNSVNMVMNLQVA